MEVKRLPFPKLPKKLSDILKEPIPYISPEVDEFEVQMKKYDLPNHVIEILITFGLALLMENLTGCQMI